MSNYFGFTLKDSRKTECFYLVDPWTNKVVLRLFGAIDAYDSGYEVTEFVTNEYGSSDPKHCHNSPLSSSQCYKLVTSPLWEVRDFEGNSCGYVECQVENDDDYAGDDKFPQLITLPLIDNLVATQRLKNFKPGKVKVVEE